MSDAMKLKDDTFSAYDNTYDITIRCETKEKQKKVIARLESTSWTPVCDRLPEFKKNRCTWFTRRLRNRKSACADKTWRNICSMVSQNSIYL
nr:MAG TPA: hypothetical protein [Caudoviricetes sp.]